MSIFAQAGVFVPSLLEDLVSNLGAGFIHWDGSQWTVSGGVESGTTFPVSPTTGQFFYFTPWSSLFVFNGTNWINVIAFASFTIYVDGTLGTDAFGNGTGTGADALKTLSIVLNYMLPINYGGDVYVKLAAGTYSENIPSIFARNTRGYKTYIDGAVTLLKQGTVTTDYDLFSAPAGTGQVQTAGSSTTVNVIGGGDTSNLVEGDTVIANGLYRRVMTIVNSTQFTVQPAVDWSAGYAWTINHTGAIYDASATHTDDQFNGHILSMGNSDPYAEQPWLKGTIADTVAASKRIIFAWGSATGSAGGQYYVWSRDTTVVNTPGGCLIYLDGLVFRCLILDANSINAPFLQTIKCSTKYLYCQFQWGGNMVVNAGGTVVASGCYFRGKMGTSGSWARTVADTVQADGSAGSQLAWCYLVNTSTFQSIVATSKGTMGVTGCIILSAATNAVIASTLQSNVTISYTQFVRYVGVSAQAVIAETQSLIQNVVSPTGFKNFNCGWTNLYSANAAQFALAT